MLSDKEAWVITWKVVYNATGLLLTAVLLRCWWPGILTLYGLLGSEPPAAATLYPSACVGGALVGLWEGIREVRRRRAEDAESNDVDDRDDPFGGEL